MSNIGICTIVGAKRYRVERNFALTILTMIASYAPTLTGEFAAKAPSVSSQPRFAFILAVSSKIFT